MLRQTISLITPPLVEPIALADMKQHLRVDICDDDGLIADLVATGRAAVEGYTRRALLTQEWLFKLDYFPGYELLYSARGYPAILLPKPPLQSLDSFNYVDVSGEVQTLEQQTDYGVSTDLFYGYQLDPGNQSQPARLTPPWCRPWPPARRVPGAVMIDFWSGYCDGYRVSIVAGGSPQELSALVMQGATFPADRDGKAIYISGAGPQSSPYSGILSVDEDGNGTISPPAAKALSNAVAFVGGFVPRPILLAIKLYVTHWYDRRGADAPPTAANATLAAQYPPGFENLLNGWVNRVS